MAVVLSESLFAPMEGSPVNLLSNYHLARSRGLGPLQSWRVAKARNEADEYEDGSDWPAVPAAFGAALRLLGCALVFVGIAAFAAIHWPF